jgi:hypothetical protein
MFAALVALFVIGSPFAAPDPLRWWEFLLFGMAYSAFLCVLAFGFEYVSRKLTYAVVFGVIALLLSGCAWFLILTWVGPEDFYRWLGVLKFMGIFVKVVMVAMIVISASGWIRYLRGTYKIPQA